MTPEEIAAKAAADAAAATAAAAAKILADKAIADKAAADKVIADAAAAAAAQEADRIALSKLTDKEAELLKEVMKNKEKAKAAETARAALEEQLKAFAGIDPAKEMLAAAEKAAADKAKADEAALVKAGEFDRLKVMMADENKKLVDAANERAKNTSSSLDAAMKTINELTVGASFNSSTFITDELVLTPRVARTVFGDNFDVENGSVVAYDKPKGEAGRTKLVDASGNPVTFEVAIQKLVESAPDKDQLLKSKLRPGAGSRTTGDTRVTSGTSKNDAGQPYGLSAMQHALNKGALKKAK